MTKLVSKWNYPTTVRFGAGRICRTARRARGCRHQAAAVRHRSRPGEAAGRGQHAEDPRRCQGAARGVLRRQAEPGRIEPDGRHRGVQDGKHDGVIAFGGGSALDLGKLIAFQAGQSRPIWDFEDIGDWWTRADAGAIAPIVAVPTTAGTGSEVGRAGVLTNEATHTKKVIFHPKMLPAIVIADPELTVGMPPFITAGTGMDALAHCLEAYCAPGYHPMADGIAVEGVRLVFENLPKAFANGKDLTARANMMSAAAMGATAFQKGLGAIHSLSHPIGALYDTHHGMTNAVFMPYVLAFNRDAIEERIARLAAYCGIKGGFDGFAKAVLKLRKELKVPHTLPGLIKGLDMDKKRKALIADMAVVDPTAGGNPVKLTKKARADAAGERDRGQPLTMRRSGMN